MTTTRPSEPRSPGERASATPRRPWLAPNVLALGFVSFFTDVSSEMIVPFLPAFLAMLGAGAQALGWVQGLADAVESVLKLVAGRWSDRARGRVRFVLVGYGLSALARPLVGAAASAWHVAAVRSADRVGKGLRGSPRDALIAHSVRPADRGAAFGFQRAMDHAGAVVGPLAALTLLQWTSVGLRTLFLLAAVPGAVAVLVAWRGVREVEAPVASGGGAGAGECAGAERGAAVPGDVSSARRDIDVDRADSASAPHRGRGLASFLLPLGLFTLGKASDVFLLQALLEQHERGDGALARAELGTFSLVWVAMHVLKSAASYPSGRFADRVGRRRTIAAGWLVHAVACAGLAAAGSEIALVAWFGVWALQEGLTEGAQKALVSELAPKRGQGSAFGWYHLTLGLLALAANVLFGTLFEHAGRSVAFATSAALALAAAPCLAWTARKS